MRAPLPSSEATWPWQVAKLLILTIGILTGVWLIGRLSHVLLLLFAAILVAVLLRAAADLLERVTPLRGRWSVSLACLLVGAALAAFLWLMGSQIRTQAVLLVEQLPSLMEAAEDWLGFDDLGEEVRGQLGDMAMDGGVATNVASTSALFLEAAANTLIVLATGVYIALAPGLYRAGLLKLLPQPRQEQADETLEATGRALRLWLLGQLVAMALVGTLTTLGLWLLGIPSALALGVLAGALEFVPFVGPLVSAVPAIALGLAEGPTTALWVIGLYAVIQLVEGNLITPLVQQHAVDLPPPLTIFAILAFGVLFGPLGILLATPLAVVCFVLVKKLWVREVLHEETELPGEDAGVDPPRTSEGH